MDLTENKKPRTYIEVRIRRKPVFVPVDKILFFKAEDKYTTLHHDAGELLTNERIFDLEKEFEGKFIRIHRSTLVAKDRIGKLTKIGADLFLLSIKGSSIKLEVSRRRLPALEKHLGIVRGGK